MMILENLNQLHSKSIFQLLFVIASFCFIRGFWDWMYPEMAGNENVEMAALGVIILWFSW